MLIVKCKNCHKQILKKKNQSWDFYSKRKYCSQECFWKMETSNSGSFKKGDSKNCFWYGKKRIELTGEKHPLWKGDNASYSAFHHWLIGNFGKAQKCVVCAGTMSTSYQWANISGQYHRDKRDYIELCASCHKKYDGGRRRFNLDKFISIS